MCQEANALYKKLYVLSPKLMYKNNSLASLSPVPLRKSEICFNYNEGIESLNFGSQTDSCARRKTYSTFERTVTCHKKLVGLLSGSSANKTEFQ